MGPARRDYGPEARTVLQVAGACGYCTHDSFASFVTDVTGVPLDRSQVSRWAAGTDHFPAQCLRLLFLHVAVPEHVQHLTQVFLGGLTCGDRVPVVSMEPVGRPGGDLVQDVLAIGSALGKLQARVADALSPRGPGGRGLTDEEHRTVDEELDTLIRTALHVRADIRR